MDLCGVFFSLSMLPPRLLQCRARPVECKQRDLGNDMPSYCATSSQARPLLPPGLSPFGYFSHFFYLLREIARRSAVAGPSPFFYSTHTCMYLLTCYRYRCRNLPRRCKTTIQVHQELRFTIKKRGNAKCVPEYCGETLEVESHIHNSPIYLLCISYLLHRYLR